LRKVDKKLYPIFRNFCVILLQKYIIIVFEYCNLVFEYCDLVFEYSFADFEYCDLVFEYSFTGFAYTIMAIAYSKLIDGLAIVAFTNFKALYCLHRFVGLICAKENELRLARCPVNRIAGVE